MTKQNKTELLPHGNCTVGQLLRRLGPGPRLRKKFLADPYLDTITFKQIAENPLALREFLCKLTYIPHCGVATHEFVRDTINSALKEHLAIEQRRLLLAQQPRVVKRDQAPSNLSQTKVGEACDDFVTTRPSRVLKLL